MSGGHGSAGTDIDASHGPGTTLHGGSPGAGATLGVCYYPEHWPESEWARDARRMKALGLAWVRVGEFAWSRIEPEPGRIELDWLERAIDTLAAEGLRVVLGTPTACPPKWLVDAMPSMLPVDVRGRTRGFGSRRHYDFSHEGYYREAARITRIVAERFGRHEGIGAWQTDNEYDCHATTLSYSRAALEGFRRWLKERYGTIRALNAAWGTVFWSMEYGGFDEVELPNLTVTEPAPAHVMDFRRYSSDMVARFDAQQVAILRECSPGRAIAHNFMGRTLAFDHFALAERLDIATWDSYPLGFLEDRSDRPAAFRERFTREGDPDFQAMHHDLYRAVGRGRWWVMEQQPGPVNWAPHNPVPAAGMVRVWTWEAFAHGAECVSYFRWRQLPFAQEQMHAGLLRPDGAEATGHAEALRVARELHALAKSKVSIDPCVPAPVAIVFDYPSAWAWETQPQGASFDYFALVFDLYAALRALGQDVDFVSSRATDWSDHRAVIVPGLFAWTAEAREALEGFEGEVLIGPRTGSRTVDFAIPPSLPPDCPALGVTVEQVGTLPPHAGVPCEGGGALRLWCEDIALADAMDLLREGPAGGATREGAGHGDTAREEAEREDASTDVGARIDTGEATERGDSADRGEGADRGTASGPGPRVLIARTDGRAALTATAREDGDPPGGPRDRGALRYLAGWPDPTLARRVLRSLLEDAGLRAYDLPDAVRMRTRGSLRIVTNYGAEPVVLAEIGLTGKRVLGDGTLRGHDVAILRA